MCPFHDHMPIQDGRPFVAKRERICTHGDRTEIVVPFKISGVNDTECTLCGKHIIHAGQLGKMSCTDRYKQMQLRVWEVGGRPR